MITLVLAMAWHRRGQTVTLALLAMVAVASAVMAPGYLRAVDRAVAVGQVRTAGAAERGLVVSTLVDDRGVAAGDAEATRSADEFNQLGALLRNLSGFRYVYAAEYPAVGIEPDNADRTRVVYRQDLCPHLVLTAGRCLIDEGEVLVGEQTARRLGLTAGDSVTLAFAKFAPDPRDPGYAATGTPKTLTVVGIYRVPRPSDLYWGGHGYFAYDSGDRPGEPVFTNRITFTATDRGPTQLSVDGTATAAALDVDNLDRLRGDLAAFEKLVTGLNLPVNLRSGIPGLLARIDSGRADAALIVPVLVVPLILLSCLAIFLAVGYGAQGRRPELAVVALRGARWWHRLWLALGENVLAVLAGAVAGCLAGQLLVDAVAAWRFPGAAPEPGLASLTWAPLAAAGAVLAALLAQRGQLLSPVAEMLRRVPSRGGGARTLAAEGVVVLFAVLLVIQLRVSGGALGDLGMTAAALVLVALALIAARVLLPAGVRYARRALDRGGLGAALAGFQLSRRPGAVRLFALLVATVAVAGYAACAVDVAARGRAVQSALGTGADRVLSVQPVTRSKLLNAVRAVDPQGAYAMAVVPLPGDGDRAPAGLAVDSTRLATVPFWPAGGPGAAATARVLRPAAPEPLLISGATVTVDVTASGFSAQKPVRLRAVLASVTGLGDSIVEFGYLRDGVNKFRQPVDTCRAGCRLNALQITTVEGLTGIAGRAVLTRVGDLAGPGLSDAAQWRMSAYGRLSAAPAGLRIDVAAPAGLTGGAWLQRADTPYPLPVASAGGTITPVVTGLDGREIPADRSVRLPSVPRAGARAALVDLEYADRLATDAALARDPQVWLAAGAPADTADRLVGQGLIITGDLRAGQVRRQLEQQGPALALWSYVLAGCLAVALGTGALVQAAAVDRRRRAEDLAALRVQGLGRGPVSRATVWTYPALVAAAVVAGVLVALAAWWLTGWALPLAGDFPQPGWPRPWVVAAVGAAALAVLGTAALAAGRNLRGHVEARMR